MTCLYGKKIHNKITLLKSKQVGKVSIILSAFLGAFHVLIIAKCQIAVDKIVGLSSREQRNV